MAGIFNLVKKVLPEPVKKIARSVRGRLEREIPFKPYLKKKNVEGVTFDFWIGDRSGRDWYDLHSTDPDWPELRFIKDNLVEKGDVVFECGGHHGCTAVVLSSWVGPAGKVVTFEPIPSNCEIIAKNIALNALQNVTLERKAVGAERGTVTFNAESNASVLLSGRGVQVEQIRLDDYAHLNPTLLKIDVEGFEAHVLRGGSKVLASRPKIVLELHTDQLADYGTSQEEIYRLIGIDRYKAWIQWDDAQPPVEYDFKKPIDKRVHLFFLPLERSTSPAA